MILFKALKLTIKHYFKIIPYLIIVLILYGIFSSVVPFIGSLIALPLFVGVAYFMVNIVIYEQKPKKSPLFLGFENGKFLYNMIYLVLREMITHVFTFVISTTLFMTLFNDIEIVSLKYNLHPLIVLVVFIIIALLPALIISMGLSMVPYLLADYKFDQARNNPLFASLKLLKNNYLRLFGMRLLFYIWYLWIIVGFFIVALWTNLMLFGGGPLVDYVNEVEVIIGAWLISILVTPLIIMPWYRMVHAVLYVKLRHKIFTKEEEQTELGD